MKKHYFDFSKLNNFSSLISALKSKKSCSVFGMGYGEKILSALNVTGKVFYVANDEFSAKKIYEEYNEITKGRAVYLPACPDITIFRLAQSNEANIERIRAIYRLIKGDADVVVASAQALTNYYPRKERFEQRVLKLSVSKTFEMNDVKSFLVANGYSSAELVSRVGQFSARGDILDIFPVNLDYPVRIEFFDNLIESIKLFDPESQRSNENKRDVFVCPCTNILLADDERKKLANKIESLKNTRLKSRDFEARLDTILGELKEKVICGNSGFELDFLFPLIEDKLSSIFDYLSDEFLIAFDETKIVYDAFSSFEKDVDERRKSLINAGETLPVQERGYLKTSEVLKRVENRTKLAFQKITNANKLFNPDEVFSFRFAPVIKYSSNFSEFVTDISLWIMDGYKIIICAGSEEKARQLKHKLEANDVYLEIDPMLDFETINSGITTNFLSNGFVLPIEKIVVVGTYDIFPKEKKENKLNLKPKAVFSVPEVGSFVVHRVHGIGKCVGITQLEGSFGIKDFVEVMYAGGDKLYVPIDQMDLLDKYSAGGEPKKLSKIGGTEFAGVKERVKKQLREIAINLLKLYAEREEKQGYIYTRDDELQNEFESRFAFTETEDQLNAIKDIKEDMENGKVMDRLVCGDVGFGKTEVALRAIFKAIANGKQVAFIAPTTLLARQHYNTCVARMNEFGIRVEVLDRFVPRKKVKEVIDAVKNHKVDLLVGTHRVLGKDIVFEDLGLVILDEEQKFGVEHKEKIKLENKAVDVITLSATPIPRTLHMALSGIRDISVIQTPPQNRIPTQTFVTEYSDALVKMVINRELERNGQVFIVYNRVETIYEFKAKIEALVPSARIVVGHGKLSGTELEDVIYDFYNHEADILICTTIIENGIDLPNANSLIVIDSDRLGLSSLYQIRGRVGRSSRAGFAYFTYKKDKTLTEEGYKRLEAIAEFTEFGSGFKVAMRDLEIRGSGNIFGAEQHGHIEKVGYELYSKMLHDTLLELKGKKVQEDIDVQVKVALDAYIPREYISLEEARMTAYKTISTLSSNALKLELEGEFEERFGKLPLPVKNLIDIAYMKNLAKNLGIKEVYINGNNIRFDFVNQEALFTLKQRMKSFEDIAVLNFSDSATIKLRTNDYNTGANLKLAIDFLVAGQQN